MNLLTLNDRRLIPVGTDTKSHVRFLIDVVSSFLHGNQNKEGCHFMIMELLTLEMGVPTAEDMKQPISTSHTHSCPM